MPKREPLTAERARELLHYDGEHLRWKVTRQKIQKGDIAGSDRDGYRRVCLDGKRHEAHRLVWLIVHGHWPTHKIDHEDQNPRNNRIENLRDVTNRENCLNQKLHRTNTSGHAGVSWDKTKNRWAAQIMVHGKTLKLGSFKIKDDAIKARKNAEIQHGFHPNHGKRCSPQSATSPHPENPPQTPSTARPQTSHLR